MTRNPDFEPGNGTDRASGERPALLELVLPIYNESHVLADSVQRLAASVERLGLRDWKIVIVDNGSNDGSDRVAGTLVRDLDCVEYLRIEQKGRGLALRTIWRRTKAEFSLYMDIDLSTDLAILPEAVQALVDGCDVVVGSRLHPGARTRRSAKREIISRAYNRLIGLLFPSRSFDDAQCGFKGVRVATVRPLLALVENNHWFFDTELLLLAESVGLEVRSLPVSWVEDTDSRVRIASTVWEDLKGLARVRRNLRAQVKAWDRLQAAQP